MRLTTRRREVLELILVAEGPVTAYQLLEQLQATRKGAVPPMVYRALEFLLENELIHKVESLSAFVACKMADHHHDAAQFLICRQCGAVKEVEDEAVNRALDDVAHKMGFHPGKSLVELRGICSDCSTEH